MVFMWIIVPGFEKKDLNDFYVFKSINGVQLCFKHSESFVITCNKDGISLKENRIYGNDCCYGTPIYFLFPNRRILGLNVGNSVMENEKVSHWIQILKNKFSSPIYCIS